MKLLLCSRQKFWFQICVSSLASLNFFSNLLSFSDFAKIIGLKFETGSGGPIKSTCAGLFRLEDTF